MKTALAALVAILALSLPAYGADSPKRDGNKRVKTSHKTPTPGKLLADKKKYLAEQGAKTAETIRANWATLKKTISSERQATAPKAKTPQKKRAAEPSKED